MKYFFSRENAAKFIGCSVRSFDRKAEVCGVKYYQIGDNHRKFFYALPDLEHIKSFYKPRVRSDWRKRNPQRRRKARPPQ